LTSVTLQESNRVHRMSRGYGVLTTTQDLHFVKVPLRSG
jgi:hypothetical protein